MKRTLSLIICLALVLSFLPQTAIFASAATSGSCGDNLTWTLDDEGVFTLSGTGDMYNWPYDWGSSETPWTEIRASIKTVVIEEGVSGIGEAAFYECRGISSVIIPKSVTTIGTYAFQSCFYLLDVYYAGSEDDWKLINIGVGNTYLTETTIHYTNIIASGECGDNLTWTIDDTGTFTVSGTGDMWDWDGYSYVPWYDLKSLIKKIVIEDGVTFISNYSFYEYENLENVTMAGSVKTVGAYAFYGAERLAEITIPEGVETIYTAAFENCTALVKATLPDSVTKIYGAVFRGCTSLVSVRLPKGITSISSDMFSRCTSLPNITIPANVTIIESCAFEKCTNFTSVVIPYGVTGIGMWAFSNCTNITTLTIPNTVTIVAKYAFERCSKITDVYYSGTKSEWEKLCEENPTICSGAIYNATIHYNYSYDASTETTLSPDGETFTIKPVNVENGKTVILALYNGDTFVGMQKAIYQGKDLTFKTDKEYTKAKIMVWNDLTNIIPVSNVEEVEAPKDDGLVDGRDIDDDSNFSDWGV